LHLLQLTCKFGFINQTETLINYQKDFNTRTRGKDSVRKEYQWCAGGQSYYQLMSWW